MHNSTENRISSPESIEGSPYTTSDDMVFEELELFWVAVGRCADTVEDGTGDVENVCEDAEGDMTTTDVLASSSSLFPAGFVGPRLFTLELDWLPALERRNKLRKGAPVDILRFEAKAALLI